MQKIPYNDWFRNLFRSGGFDNPDSGTRDTLQEVIKCAKIIEVGPDCKRVQKGDDVYYDSRNSISFTFYVFRIYDNNRDSTISSN